MKFVRFALLLAMVVALFGTVQPVAAVVYTYTSGYQVQNLSGAIANISIDYYSVQTSGGGGTSVTTATDTVPAFGSKTYFPIHVSSGFSGSVVISSDQPLASIVNLIGSGPGNANASYIGSSSGSGTMYLPLLMKGNSGITTWYSLQNAGSTDATVNVSYSDGTTAGPITVKAGASYVFDQGAETHSIPVFAGTITSSQPVVAVVVQEGTRVKTILATSGFTGGETNVLMPLINANNGPYITGAQIQNIGTAPTNVTVSYTPVPGFGTPCTETRTIAPGASQTFALAAFAGAAQPGMTTTCVKARFVGAAQVTANSASQPLAATVNQATSAIGGAYSSFSPSQATAKLVLPLIMDRNSGWWTGFNLVNVGTGPAAVNCTFTNTSYTVSKTLAVGEVLNDIQNNKIADRYVGSGTCTATGAGAKIVAVVNEIAPSAGDALLTYEGVNVAP